MSLGVASYWRVAASLADEMATFCIELLAGTDTVPGILNVALVAFISTAARISNASRGSFSRGNPAIALPPVTVLNCCSRSALLCAIDFAWALNGANIAGSSRCSTSTIQRGSSGAPPPDPGARWRA